LKRIKLFNLDKINLDDHSRPKVEVQALKFLRVLKNKPLILSIFLSLCFQIFIKAYEYLINPTKFSFRAEEILLFTVFLFLHLIFFTLISRGIKYYGRSIDRLILKGNEYNESFSNSALLGLKKIAEIRDSSTQNHLAIVGKISSLIARKLRQNEPYRDYITESYIRDLELAAPLHEIGRIGIADHILYKDSGLTDPEFELMKMHVVIGGDLLSEMEKELPYQSYFALAREMAYHHHQRWDGRGYPNVIEASGKQAFFIQEGIGKPLEKQEIPLAARIVAIADVYDALVTKKNYKEAVSHQQAVNLICEESGKHFDPDVVTVFLSIQNDVHEIMLSSA
jgi:HD-GYP domain-containing protein (c-di-GMP phosphodiesterase class II)